MSNNLFFQLLEIDSSDKLSSFINKNIQSIYDFYNLDHKELLLAVSSIDEFIQVRNNFISDLDYSQSNNKAFILILLDFCERFNLISSTARVCTIIEHNHIVINMRMKAALLFLHPKPHTNSELVDKFDAICNQLDKAIEIEEDNNKKSIITFLNYYGIIFRDTNTNCFEQIKNKIKLSIENKSYKFLNEIPDLLSVNTYAYIQQLIDNIHEHYSISKEVNDGYLIEKDTNYSKQLENVSCDFDKIRTIALNSRIKELRAESTINRGVKILESEDELFQYFYRFGNMHKAKILSALTIPFPQEFNVKLNLIDWGCGQGFASMLFLENFSADMVEKITLIDPSEIALKRAALHCKKYAPLVNINTICKTLDDLTVSDLKLNTTEVTINLFSNILDIDNYSQQHLIDIIEQNEKGHIYYVCVSPYIDEIKTNKLLSFKDYFSRRHPESFHLYKEAINTKINKFWCCNNVYTHRKCLSHDNQYGCNSKWTRVMQVFDIQV